MALDIETALKQLLLKTNLLPPTHITPSHEYKTIDLP